MKWSRASIPKAVRSISRLQDHPYSPPSTPRPNIRTSTAHHHDSTYNHPSPSYTSRRGNVKLIVLTIMAPNSTRLIKQSYERCLRPHYITGLSTSWLLSPWLLFALRALISLYAFAVLFTRIGRWEQSDDPGDEGDAGRSFSFFTVLSYWGIAFYSAFAAAHSASFALKGKAWLESWPGWLRFAHSAFYVTVTVFPWVVTGENS